MNSGTTFTMNKIFKLSIGFVFSLLAIFSFSSGIAAADSLGKIGEGVVDIIKQDNDKIVVQGWAGADKPAQQIASISVWFSDKKVYDSQFERYERPDVAKSKNRSDWLRSGWRLRFDLPSDSKTGEYSVKVIAKLDTGKELLLATNAASQTITLDGSFIEQKKQIRGIKFAIIVALLALAIIFFYSESITGHLKRIVPFDFSPSHLFGTSLTCVFFLFVGLGLTGSSFNIGLAQSPFVKGSMLTIAGQNQGIRSDEWLVLTPLAIAQFNHHPANPVVNKNHGEDGQNMLIVGMTGVPVAHISEIAKPATWGYFLFDLKRALAWHWLFPIFACLITLWATTSILMPGNWKASFVISLLFSSAPYVVAWSNWPAYAVFFPSLIFICANAILRTHSTLKKILLGILAGITFAGFVFVLYPPWQVSLAYIFIALTIGVVIRDKLYRNCNLSVIIALLTSIIIAAVILAFWWIDAKSAIQAMEETVYPGQRTTVVGGTMSMPMLLRGFTNLVTLQQLDSPFSNQSEIASFTYLLLPLAFIFCLKGLQKSLSALEISLAVAISFILFFMFAGIPTEIAKLSLWGRVPSNRADLALGLATLLLSGLLLNIKDKRTSNKNIIQFFSVTLSIGWAYIVYVSFRNLNDTITAGFTSNLIIAMMIFTATLGYALSTSNFKVFVFLSLGLSTATTLAFNPINVAPHHIESKFNISQTESLTNQRVLVLENMTPAMYLVASGVPVANGIFYYPQKSLWTRLDPSGVEADTYNRYQHLSYIGEENKSDKPWSLETPRPDVVRVKVDLENFNFALSGATLLTAPTTSKPLLEKNKTLYYLQNSDGWDWYTVKK